MSDRTATPPSFNQGVFFSRIDQHIELRGLRVVLYDGQHMHTLREGPLYCAPDLMTIVIKPHIDDSTLQSPKAAEARESRFYSELFGGVPACGAAVIGWVVVAGSSGAAPVTGGASTFVAALAAGAAMASSAQCLNASYRLYNELGDRDQNDWLDSQDWYINTGRVIDVISIAGAATAVGATVRMAIALKRSTGKSMRSVLAGLSRQERMRIAEEIIRMENPGISNGALKAMLRAGIYPRRLSNAVISHSVRLQLKDALGAALSFTGSASSGTLREFAVGLAQSVDTY